MLSAYESRDRCSLLLLIVVIIAFCGTGQSSLLHPYEYEHQKLASKPDSFLPGSVGELERRIPRYVEPLDYFIRIRPYFPETITNAVDHDKSLNMTFDGISTFVFRANEPRMNVTLHSSRLNYTSVKVMHGDGRVMDGNANFTFNITLEHIIIHLKQELVTDETYMIQFVYRGGIHDYLETGLYYSPVWIEGEKIFLLATHMEPARARWVFPCLDEPAYKAVFHITLIYPKGLVALANAMERPAVPVKSFGNWDVIQFPPSLRMSTYLVAFAIGDYENQETYTKDGTLIRIWGWRGQKKYLEWAKTITPKCLYQLGQYTNFKYPGDKSDQLGMPQFVAGAMENYGLIIYKYQYISYNPKVHSTKVKEMASETICHELSHQWFGDTVTAQWWSDLFLNEGFATYFQTKSQLLAEPEQADFLNGQFMVNTIEPGLATDASISLSHPIYDMNGPFFDPITYKKGGSVLKMIESFLGPEVFREALQDYIHTYKFSNANHTQLFEMFTKAAQKAGIKDWCGEPMDMKRFLDPWFLQQCFPVVTLTNNKPMSDFTVTQQPFNEISRLPNNTQYNYSWPIPFFWKNYRTYHIDHTTKLKWMIPDYYQCPSHSASKSALSPKREPTNFALHWDLGNTDSKTFMRVEYDDVAYARLMKQLKTRRDKDFGIDDKVILIADQLAFAKHNEELGKPFSFKKTLDLISTIIPGNDSYAIFKITQGVIDRMEKYFMDGPDYPLFKKGMQEWLTENYKKLGYTVSDIWDPDMSRYLMFPYAIRYEVNGSSEKAMELFNGFLRDCNGVTTSIDNCSKVKPDIRIPVYCAGVRFGPQSNFDALFQFYKQQEHDEYYFYHEYYAMLQGLSCSKRAEDIKRVIPRSLNVFRMPPNPKYFVPPFSFIAAYPEGSQFMADYLEADLTEIMSSDNFEEYLKWMTSTWYSKGRFDQYVKLQQKMEANLPNLHLDQTSTDEKREIIEKYHNQTSAQVEWWQKHFPHISRIFYDHFAPGSQDVEYWLDRLPKETFKPTLYHVKVRPYFPSSAKYEWYKNLTFDGSVDIDFEVLKRVTDIKLNAHRMVIEAANIRLIQRPTDVSYQIESIEKDFTNAFLIIHLPSGVNMDKSSRWTLSIKYIGFIYPQATKGVYLNTNYFEFNGKMAYIFSTFFEKGPSARSLVPCFDEPSFKAKWQLTIDHPADMIALGNMPDEGFTVAKDDYGWATTYFPPTPPMSSYLFAAAVGHFASLETVSKTGVLVRAWAWTGMERYAEFGLKTVAGTVDFMATYFDYPFPMPKLDAVALPQYTSRKGAEEHWGVMHIQYERELTDPHYTTGWLYFFVASFCAHETVHQWFGDLVTTAFFDEMFLNEAMAQYWETNGIMYAFPEQAKMGKFERFRKGMDGFAVDSSPDTSKPVIPKKPKYSTGIIYDKGATLLHMLSNTVSPEVLQLGLQKYLKKYKYSNVVDSDLWGEITQAAATKNKKDWDGKPLNVQLLMDTWTKQATYPVLKVSYDDASKQVTYSQEPFIVDAVSKLGPSPYDYKWIIPVFSQTAEGSTFNYFTGADGGNPSVWKRPLNGWQVENAGFAGFFRVWYDDATWQPILNQLQSDREVFDELTRAEFIADAVALRERGSLEWKRVLDLALQLEGETELAPWYAFSKTFDELNSISQSTGFSDGEREKFQLFARKILKNIYEKIAWKNTTDWSQDMLASYITEWACDANLPQCLNDAAEKLNTFARDCEHSKSGTGICNRVSPNVRRTQYCWGTLMNADENNVVGKMYDWFVENSKYFERDADNLLEGRSCTQNADKFNDLIQRTLSGELPAKTLEYLGKHDGTGQRLWEYFKKNTDEIIFGVPSILEYMNAAMAKWSTSIDIDLVNHFMEDSSLLSEDNKEEISQALSNLEKRIDYITANKQSIVDWLGSNLHRFFE